MSGETQGEEGVVATEETVTRDWKGYCVPVSSETVFQVVADAV
jgi:hypothetical protein